MPEWKREDIVWVAGFLEGEGCITRNVTYKKSAEYKLWLLTASSTDLDVLLRLRDIVGFGRIYPQKRPNPKHKPTWQWHLYRQPEVYALLVAIYQFMGHRRKARIREAIIEMGSRPPWKHKTRQWGRKPAPIKGADAYFNGLVKDKIFY